MDLPPLLSDLLRPGREAFPVGDGIWSVIPNRTRSAHYDRRAIAYDWVVGSALYNRLAWGASTNRYRAFAARAVSSGSGPLLDAGCGSAASTAEAYVQSARPIVLVDRSLGMLELARHRLSQVAAGPLPMTILLLQADVLDLPFHSESFATVLSMGMLHLFDDQRAAALLTGLAGLAAPFAKLFLSSLVAERSVGRCYLALLHVAGEVAAPRSARRLNELLRTELGANLEYECDGSMGYVVVNRGS